MPQFGRVVLGGTFDRLHLGHEALLATAFRVGRTVAIGLTTERYLAGHPKPAGLRIPPYSTRRRALARWLAARYARARWTISPLNDPFGGSVEEGVAALVVSADTSAGGRAVNAERRRRGRRAIPIVVVPLVLADDLRPLSSRRIREGEIDRRGRRRSEIEVGLAVEATEDLAPAVRSIRRAFPRAHVVRVEPSLPWDSTRRLRAAAGSAARRAELGIAVARGPDGQRRASVAARGVILEPRSLRGITPLAFSTALARFLLRSGAAKGFRSARR